MSTHGSFNIKKIQRHKAALKRIILFFTIGFSANALSTPTGAPSGPDSGLIIDGLKCLGNEKTECDFITKKYYQSVGDRVDPNEIADARLRLGTLQQFKDVSVFLEKSSQRGHVNVVFRVEEAKQIQYSLGAGYRKLDHHSAQGQSYFLNAGATDFNFLGSGKELTISVYGSSIDSDPVNDLPWQIQQHSRDIKTKGVNLNYYDPHFLDSVNYFLNASIEHHASEQEYEGQLVEQGDEVRKTFDDSLTMMRLGLGRRFASHSYVSIDVSESDTSGSGSVSLNYGWNSTDDFLFPTQGSTFSSTFSSSYDDGPSSLTLSYHQNIAVSNDLIFAFGASESTPLEKRFRSNYEFSPNVNFSLTDIHARDKVSGKYIGWRYSLSADVEDLEKLSFAASYIYQTEQLVMRLSIGYEADLGGN